MYMANPNVKSFMEGQVRNKALRSGTMPLEVVPRGELAVAIGASDVARSRHVARLSLVNVQMIFHLREGLEQHAAPGENA